MITAETLMSIDKSNLQEASKILSREDIDQLVQWLSLKEDALRYHAFLLLQYRSADHEDVFEYWDIFLEKLNSDNSYQRSIGAMLLAENAKWDKGKLTEAALDAYLTLLNDEKPITIRQCIQSLHKIVDAKPKLSEEISKRLIEIDLMSVKDTMRKLILLDIINVLLVIRKVQALYGVESFIINALSGEILDSKSKKLIKSNM